MDEMPTIGVEIDDMGRSKKSSKTKPRKEGASGYPGHRSKFQKEEDKVRMAEMLRRGWTLTMIADALGLSVSAVHVDRRQMLAELAARRDSELKEMIAAKAEEYAEVKREAWEAWERSKGIGRKIINHDTQLPLDEGDNGDSDSGNGGNGDNGGSDSGDGSSTALRPIAGLRRIGRATSPGDVGFLRTIIDCLGAERELLGLDAPKNVQADIRVIPWDELAGIGGEGEDSSGGDGSGEGGIGGSEGVDVVGLGGRSGSGVSGSSTRATRIVDDDPIEAAILEASRALPDNSSRCGRDDGGMS